MASNARQLALGGAVALGIGILALILAPGPKPDPVTPDPVAEAAAPPTATQTDAPPAKVAAAPRPPAIDGFYMAPDGVATVNGRADAGALLDIRLAGQSVMQVTADSNGMFAATVVFDPSDDPRMLTVVADPDGDAIASDNSIMVGPTRAVLTAQTDESAEDIVVGAITAPAPVMDEPAPTDTAVAVAAPAPEIAAQEIADEPASAAVEPAPASPTVLIADSDGVRILQSDTTPPEVMSHVALDTITYDPQGEVVLAGRAAAGEFVRVYINNQPVTTSRISGQGDWRIDLPQVDTGIYTLRIDEVDTQGDVVSRIETPFKREEPADVVAIMAAETATEGFQVATRTVQPGATLWAIAREEMGDGIMYVAVYEANRDLIRNPDLIYPGQVFRIPSGGE